MKTTLRLLLCGATLLATAAAQAQSRQPRTVAAFQAVQAGGGIDVFLTQGPTAAVVVEAAPEVQSHITTTVQGNTLQVGWEQDHSWRKMLSNKGTGKVSVYITCPRLTALGVSGGSDAKGETPFTAADDLRLSASGGSDITVTVTAKSLSSHASGGGDITVSGRVERQEVSISGGSDYHAFALQSTTAEINASGGSDAAVLVSGELRTRASGGSAVRYKGDARVVSAQSSGGSSTRPAR